MTFIEHPDTFEKDIWEQHLARLEQMDETVPAVLHARKIAAYVLYVINKGIIEPDFNWRNGDWDQRVGNSSKFYRHLFGNVLYH